MKDRIEAHHNWTALFHVGSGRLEKEQRLLRYHITQFSCVGPAVGRAERKVQVEPCFLVLLVVSSHGHDLPS